MANQPEIQLTDTGERMIPTRPGEVSVVFSRHQFAYQYAHQFATGKEVLDVGCGTGYGCKIFSERATYVLGIDHSAEAIQYCRTHFNAPNIEFQQVDASVGLPNKRFDMVVSFQVIEHLHDVGDFVDRLKHVVKINGLILITTPNVRTVEAAGAGNPFHHNEMNFDQLKRLIGSKFGLYDIIGIGYASPSLLRSMIQKMPLYRCIGLMMKQSSRLKKVATQALDLTHFRIIEDNVARDAIDLLAVCTKVI